MTNYTLARLAALRASQHHAGVFEQLVFLQRALQLCYTFLHPPPRPPSGLEVLMYCTSTHYSSGQGKRPSATDIGFMIYLHERTLSVGITGGLALVTCTHAFALLPLARSC